MIVDTTFIIDLLKNNEAAIKKLETLTKNNENLILTSLVIFETFSGIYEDKKYFNDKERIASFFKGQTVLSFNPEHAEKAGEIEAELRKNGKMIGTVDTMLAGIALIKNEKILTRNVKDFSKIKNLQIETY